MDFIYHSYPTFALVASIGLTISAVRTSSKSHNDLGGKIHDPITWLRSQPLQFWKEMALPLYMLHQYEEYGRDVLGRKFAFQGFLCENLGFNDISQCPGTPRLLFLINVVYMWYVAISVRIDNSRDQRTCLVYYGIAAVNTLIHCLGVLRAGYNPGVLTSVFMVFPAAALALDSMRREVPTFKTSRDLVVAGVGGVVTHIFLLGGIRLYGGSAVGDAAVVGSLLLVFVLAKRF